LILPMLVDGQVAAVVVVVEGVEECATDDTKSYSIGNGVVENT
jgi:hypothetical protein